ncbi:hypothetical protein BH24ACT2_BH24ACT2_15000 [soil metagenome]
MVGRAARAHQELISAGTDPVTARGRVVAGVTVAVAGHLGVELSSLALLSRWGRPVAVEVAPGDASPGVVGVVHEALLDHASRRSGGAFYTPPDVAAVIVGWALEGRPAGCPVVCDPAVGGGAFLLAAAEALTAAGRSRAEVVGECLVGADVDPLAVAVTEAVLALWCRGAAVPRLVVGDALALDPPNWPAEPDVVVGNPPFLNQLERATARRRDDIVALRRRYGTAVGADADTAVLFLVMGARLVRPGGVVALILPESFLATRDAHGARSAALSDATLEALWIPSVPVFASVAVRICVPVLRRGVVASGRVRLWRGSPPQLAATIDADADVLRAAPTWSHLLVAGSGIPDCELEADGTLGDWCHISADFRAQYYGIAPFLVDDPEGTLDPSAFPPLVTVGLIDPAECHWGRRRTRHHGHPWEAPRVDRERLMAETDLGPWARARLVPKVVVATQTKVVEAAVDVEGAWLPSTPLISVVAPPARLWHVAAALLSPPVTAWALRRWAGTALAAGGLKLSAAQVRAVPSPVPGPQWDTAADAVRQATEAGDEGERRRWLLAAAAASSRAYGVDDPAMVRWWADRLPRRR